ncbi:MAG: hypothetical protein ACOX50_02570 [Patescibacteria group bacterium]|jgi:hypothetical protein
MQVFVRVDINTCKCDGGNVTVSVDGEKAAAVDVTTKEEAPQETYNSLPEAPVAEATEAEAAPEAPAETA